MTDEKYILVTGAASGLGKAAAKKLAESGFKVFASVRKEVDLGRVEKLHVNVKGVLLDVTNQESITKAYNYISEITGGLHGIVNNAGTAFAGPVEYLPVEVLQKQIDVNVYGGIRVVQTFMPLLRNSNDARIVNLSSMASFASLPFLSPYCVSKKMLDMFFNSLLLEAKMPNLKVISIKPGVVRTAIWDTSLNASEASFEDFPPEAKVKYRREWIVLSENARKNNEKGLEPEQVADLISHVMTVKKPKLSYTIGRDAKMLELFSRLPLCVMNFFIKKGLEKKISVD